MPLYSYVGPKDLLLLVDNDVERFAIYSHLDVLDWKSKTEQTLQKDKTITATYIIDTNDTLYIGDRHMEHVSCAIGDHIKAAGEITFEITTHQVSIIGATNQSTGYCPEKSCWNELRKALEKTSMRTVNGFTESFEFRICTHCKTINIIKESVFYCAVCDSKLSKHWNINNRINQSSY
ncbi:hypothetical protein EUZ85_14310 [Hahella sp. KA22]|uniref:hypothetical protein n=1 Tax=Hahella sp. KA22 TaxID=1628392 RepID=UPI000FDD74CC|nr:hypothetical protein [Hahella sp. KA22]AZZ91839.1 hypothetical protein ENC22_11745 [Hahella sp. KA22]QAY55210.1 hypothetical protein EUZ85_14310 [Hahella sp. KA22]